MAEKTSMWQFIRLSNFERKKTKKTTYLKTDTFEYKYIRPFSGIRTPHQLKDSPSVFFYDIHFRPSNTKVFLKVHWASMNSTMFKRSARQKKVSQKS